MNQSAHPGAGQGILQAVLDDALNPGGAGSPSPKLPSLRSCSSWAVHAFMGFHGFHGVRAGFFEPSRVTSSPP